MNQISCRKLWGKAEFESYSEFYFALCIGAECKRRGMQLDMSEMVIDKDCLPKEHWEYFRYLVSIGAVDIGSEVSTTSIAVPELHFDNSIIAKKKDKIFKFNSDNVYWSPDYVASNLVGDAECSSLTNLRKMGVSLINTVAFYIVSVILGDLPKKPLVVSIQGIKVINTYIYTNLVSCNKTLDFFREYVKLDIDFSNCSVDIDYSIFCNNAIKSGRYKDWSVQEKKEIFEKLGYKVGMIALLWERKGMCVSNPIGKIESSRIVRVNEITETDMYVTCISINKTKEENMDDFYDIPEERRGMFLDMLDAKPYVREECISLYNLGIENYMHSESSFITKIDKGDFVSKKVTIDGNTGYTDMSSRDAIYWLLCQYDVDFNRDIYRELYSEGKELLWDKYGVA